MNHAESLDWLGQHLLITTALAAIVFAACQSLRLKPAACHVLWLVVLVRLLVPSVATWPWTIPVRGPVTIAGARAPMLTADEPPTSAPQEISSNRQSVHSASGTLDPPFLELTLSGEASHLTDVAVSAPPVSPAGSQSGEYWLRFLTAVWLMGSVFVAAILIRRIRRVGRILAVESATENWLACEVADWSERLGVTTPTCTVSDRFPSPFLWCSGKLRLVWPRSMAGRDRREQARPVIVHELAHLKRRDHWTAWLEMVALVVWWWNPLFWLIRRELRTAAEMACDAWVVQLLPDQRRDYAEILLEFSRHGISKKSAVAVGAVGDTRNSFTRRLKMIMSEDVPARFSKWTLTGAVLLGLISLPAFSTEPTDREQPPDRETSVAGQSGQNPGSPSTEFDEQIRRRPIAGTQTQENVPPGAAAAKSGRRPVRTPPASAQNPFGPSVGSGDPFGIDPAAPNVARSPTLQEVLEKIRKQYYGQVDQKELEKAAIAAILAKLEGDAAVLTPDEMRNFTRQVEDQLAGVGIALDIDKETRQPAVQRVILRSPAQLAGVRPDDLIVSIDGEATKDASLANIVRRLRGKRGTKVTLGIARGDEELEVEVTRETFSAARVEPWSATPDGRENYWLDRSIGYVHIPSFTKQTASQFRDVVSKLKQDGAKSLVLDLRNCPGGLLTAATEVADLFIDEGIIVSSKSRARSENTTFHARPETPFAELNVVVLVNRHTASAAEIVAACLQDHHRAAIVGEQTFGRGLVQSLLKLSDGGGLKLTTAAWMRPNGRTLHRRDGKTDWGVKPDPGLMVEQSDEAHQRLAAARRALLSGRDISLQNDAPVQKALEFLRKS